MVGRVPVCVPQCVSYAVPVPLHPHAPCVERDRGHAPQVQHPLPRTRRANMDKLSGMEENRERSQPIFLFYKVSAVVASGMGPLLRPCVPE